MRQDTSCKPQSAIRQHTNPPFCCCRKQLFHTSQTVIHATVAQSLLFSRTRTQNLQLHENTALLLCARCANNVCVWLCISCCTACVLHEHTFASTACVLHEQTFLVGFNSNCVFCVQQFSAQKICCCLEFLCDTSFNTLQRFQVPVNHREQSAETNPVLKTVLVRQCERAVHDTVEKVAFADVLC